MNNLLNKIALASRTRWSKYQKKRFSRYRAEYALDLSFSEAAANFQSRNLLYAYLHQYFYHQLPQALRTHREYFALENRGFGEEAFHSMWYLILREFKPKTFLEIGVFRGQVISLWALTSHLLGYSAAVHCISPFTSIGDSVSRYRDMNFLDDVLDNFRHFNLPAPNYLKSLSTDEAALAYMRGRQFDCIYIDGGHEYEVVLSDYRNSVAALNSGGILVMDDSSLYTDFNPPAFSFAGHPGPSKVARDFADHELEFLAGVGHQNVYRKR
jgi:predicted O-methyltransferase YrrM